MRKDKLIRLKRASERFAKLKEDFPFYISGEEETKIIYETIFKHVEKSLKLVVDKLDLSILSNRSLIKELKALNDKNVKIHILLNNVDLPDPNPFDELAKNSKFFKIRKVINRNDILIADDMITKIEKMPKSLGSVVNFNDNNNIRELNEIFDKNEEDSKEVIQLKP